MKQITFNFFLLFILCNICHAQLAINEYALNDENEIIASLVVANNKDNVLIKWEATCYCKIAYHNLTNKEKATGVCLDLTSIVNTSFGGVRPQRDENVRKCNEKCTNAVTNLTQQQKNQIANCACAAGMTTGTPIRAYAAVGSKEYDSAAPIGSIVNDPPKYTTECLCPDTWSYNKDQKKCTKPICDVILPSNNQNLGNWGFIWNNKIYQNREANCVQKLVSAAFCGMY
jgi:hypothetical protein